MYQDLFTVIAPATLAALIFWSGVLYQRIKDLEQQRVADKKHVTVVFDEVKKRLEKVDFTHEKWYRCNQTIEAELNSIKVQFATITGKFEALEQRIGAAINRAN